MNAHTPRVFPHIGLLACLISLGGCSTDPGSNDGSGGSANGGAKAYGGATNGSGGANGGSTQSSLGGALGSGGSPSGGAGNGGTTAANGGATNGTGGQTAAGGTQSANGGNSSGGKTNASGGESSSTGGKSNSSGGSANGGASSSKGGTSSSTGGSGGASSGGTSSATGGTSSGTCPSTALKSGDSNRTIQVGGSSRSYVLHVPSGYDGSKAVPLVVDFHPLGGSGPNERSGSPYPAQTDKDGVVMAFPSGLSGPSGGAWNVGPCCVANTDDVAFAKALVADVEKVACIDAKRVYAVGFSMGGGMSHYLACHAADVFAAVAPAAFDLLQENVGTCKPARPITVVSFRGTSDPIVPYGGGKSSVVQGMPVTFLGAKATFQKWAELNQCTGSASAEDSQGCSTYASCQAGVTVALCTKQGGSHEAGNAAYAWPILKKYTLP